MLLLGLLSLPGLIRIIILVHEVRAVCISLQTLPCIPAGKIDCNADISFVIMKPPFTNEASDSTHLHLTLWLM